MVKEMPQNIRQVELKARLEDMIREASILVRISAHIIQQQKQNNLETYQSPYDIEHDVEEFLAKYRVKYGVGYYASKRYFSDFETLEYFERTSKGYFRINYQKIQNNFYYVQFPPP